MSRKHKLLTYIILIMILVALPGCLFRRQARTSADVPPGDQPDKILYEKAMAEIKRARYDIGRLTLQTLINTYPDSEYLAKAKLAIADSYYKEGGSSGLTQAEAEYKDFITFFPTAPEAPEAQFRVAMAHYRMMGKADRDRTEARLAEVEFKEFLLKYPDSPLMPRAKARLRQVQEVLAQGEYKIARLYFSKGAMPAARSRFLSLVNQYPNFSKGDSALWYLGQTLERMKRPQQAPPYYARLITEHPLSPLVPDAKKRLTALEQPIPTPTKAMLARAEADAVKRPGKSLFGKVGGLMSSAPDTSATRQGPVRLGQPPPEAEVAVAEATPPAAPSAGIVVQPVGESSLRTGQAIPTKTEAQNPTSQGNAAESRSGSSNATSDEGTGGTQKQDVSSSSGSQEKGAANESNSRKKRRGIFKRIIKPF